MDAPRTNRRAVGHTRLYALVRVVVSALIVLAWTRRARRQAAAVRAGGDVLAASPAGPSDEVPRATSEIVDPAKPGAEKQQHHGSYRSGFAFGILSFLAVAFLGLLSTIVTARIYGVHIIGEFALTITPVSALWVLSTAKEQAALIKEITGLPRRHLRVSELFGAVFTFSTALTFTMSALAAVAVWFLFRGPLHVPYLVGPAFVSLAGYALVTNTAWNFDAIFSAFVAGRQLFWVRLHETVSFLAIAIAIGLNWKSVWGLVIATIGGSFTSLVHRTVIVRSFARLRMTLGEYRSGLQALPGLLRFGLKITPGSIAQGLGQQVGVLAIRIFGGSVATIGAYSRAQTIPERVQQVNLRVVEVLYPTLVGRRSRGDHEGFDRALTDTVRYTLGGLLLLAAVIGGAAAPILRVFGPGFSRASSVLTLLMVYPALNSVSIAQTQAFLALDLPGLSSVVAVVRMLVSVALTVALTPLIGITGPAVALLAGAVLDVGWKTLVLRPYLASDLSVVWPLRERAALITGYAGALLTAYAVTHELPGILGLVVGLCVSAAVGVLLLVGLGAVNRRDRDRVREILSTVRARARASRGQTAAATAA